MAGLAVIGFTNAVALGGAAYNRSGEVQSTLNVTERELRPPYTWRGQKENSGMTLRLRWRVLPGADHNMGRNRIRGDFGGTPAWLDAQKMASLGFNVTLSTESRDANGISPFQRQLPRDALIVLEMAGPAYEAALDRAANEAKELEAKNERGEGKRLAEEMLDREAHRSSRLFAVDAGLDPAALRSKFPDRAKYAIVRGQVRPAQLWESKAPAGIVSELSAAEVNVPLAMRTAFEGVAPDGYSAPTEGNKHFEAKLAFGQRLEPWLISAIGAVGQLR